MFEEFIKNETLSTDIVVKFNLKENNVDTVPTLNINWSKQPTDLEYSHLSEWLKVRLKTDKLDIVSVK